MGRSISCDLKAKIICILSSSPGKTTERDSKKRKQSVFYGVCYVSPSSNKKTAEKNNQHFTSDEIKL